MIDLPAWLIASPLYNPIFDPRPPTPWQVVAGPFGLLLFLPLIPALRIAARFDAKAAICVTSLAWLVATLNPIATAILLGWVFVAAAFVLSVSHCSRRGVLSPTLAIGAIWVGVHLLALPFWLRADLPPYGWQSAPAAALHAIGLAYFVLRMVALGLDRVRSPAATHSTSTLAAWLLFPPIMRLGPIMSLREFEEKLRECGPRGPVHWPAVREHALRFVGGMVLLGGVLAATPKGKTIAESLFEVPQRFETIQLIAAIYLVPLQIYLMLWSYNELAGLTSTLAGVPTRSNFDHVPAATSVRDFWRRWHVTVGGWIRDYIYIPLGGNRRSAWLTYSAAFGYCAIWHGASWSFLAWAASQALILGLQNAYDSLGAKRGARKDRPVQSGWKLGFARFATLQYQTLTIFIFADFEHCGWRVARELLSRLAEATGLA